MFIQSFILCIIAIFVIFYKKNDNISFYKKINDSQKKVLLLSNIIIFRNSLLNYCDSEKLTDLINEIKNNDLLYYDQLFKIKKKIDIYYKLRLNTNYIDSDSDINDESDEEYNSDNFIDTFCKKTLFFTATPKNSNGIMMYESITCFDNYELIDDDSVIKDEPDCGKMIYEYMHLNGVNDNILNDFTSPRQHLDITLLIG